MSVCVCVYVCVCVCVFNLAGLSEVFGQVSPALRPQKAAERANSGRLADACAGGERAIERGGKGERERV